MHQQSEQGTLCLHCHVPAGLWYPCYVTVARQRDGHCVLSQWLPANEWEPICLPEGRYRVRVRNTVGLDPLGFSQWVQVKAGECVCIDLCFSVCADHIPLVTLDVTVSDAHYPNIIPINGGITLCQQPITS